MRDAVHCTWQVVYSCDMLNGINRWYDKALQFIIARSGEVAICNEHRYDYLWCTDNLTSILFLKSFAEAIPTMALADHIMDELSQDDNTVDPLMSTTVNTPRPDEIALSISQDLIDGATLRLDKYVIVPFCTLKWIFNLNLAD